MWLAEGNEIFLIFRHTNNDSGGKDAPESPNRAWMRVEGGRVHFHSYIGISQKIHSP